MTDILVLELKRNLNKVFIAIFLLLVSSSLFINQESINKYKHQIKRDKEFVQVETKKVEAYFSWSQYLSTGFTLRLSPSPLSTLFCDSSTLSTLHALIDSGFKHDLSRPEIGEYIFKNPTGGSIDSSWYLLFILSIQVLTWGWFSFRNTEYLKYLMTFASSKSVHFGIVFGRIFFLIAALLVMVFFSWIQFLLNGIFLNFNEIKGLLSFFVVSIIVMAFILVCGSIIGTIKSVWKGALIAFILWSGVLFLWPKLLNLWFSNKAEENMKSIFNHQIEKMEILIEFERKSLNYLKTVANKPKEERLLAYKKFTEAFLNHEFKRIEELDLYMLENTSKMAQSFHFWSMVNPVTFYKSVNNELSSLGYHSYESFYRDNQRKKKGFTRYGVNRRFNPDNGKIEPYLLGDELIFHAEPRLPAYFLVGIIFHLSLIGILFCLSYLAFKKAIFPRPEYNSKNLDFNYTTGKHFAQGYENPDFPNQVFNVFMGYGMERKFSGKISIDGENIVTERKLNLVYLPNPDTIPGDIKALSLLTLITSLLKIPKSEKTKIKEEFGPAIKKRFAELDKLEKIEFLYRLSKLKKAKVYLFNDFIFKIPMESADKIFKELNVLNALIIELFTVRVTNQNYDYYSDIYLKNSEYQEKVFKR